MDATWLVEHGVAVTFCGDGWVEFTTRGRTSQLRLLTPARAPRPSEVRSPAPAHTVMALPRASATLRDALTRHGWSWVSDTGHARLRLIDGPLELTGAATIVPSEAPAPSRASRGALSVVRMLVISGRGPAATQTTLAARCGLSQPRVSQILRELRDDGLVERRAAELVSPTIAARWWLDRYRGPSGVTTRWYGLDDPWSQAEAILGTVDNLAGDLMVGGDLAADVIAPWRRPVRAHLYARVPVDPPVAGFIRVGPDATATLVITHDDDPQLWSAATRHHKRHVVTATDPLQAAWDLMQAGGTDADQAVDAVLASLTESGRW